ncbi:putative PKS-NRPS protein [Colletotrichum somersetense]|nr:putative PKS-NRPS protein [Colletotrichum somersetense]
MSKHDYIEEPIAIIGSSCRFPGGSTSPSKLWDLLEKPRDLLREFDPERISLKRFYHRDGEHHGSTNVINQSYTLEPEDDSRLFDASFFGITPMEASGMDPQQRQMLEIVYEAFESAGLTLEQLRGSLTSVHVGVMTNDWAQIQLRDPETLAQYAATGTSYSIMSNRISYIFDLKGPSVTLDTACSSSLVALHYAARGLLDNDSETAVVAGVNLILDPSVYITESKLHMLSPDARSRMWDKDANGYARGEGTAALILKKLSRALEDGDHIEGIIRGSGVNSDGLSPGITMPFAPTQSALIRSTYRRAGLDPAVDRPQYFECHGTGTPAGDPVEARAVSEAFAVAPGSAARDEPLYVGSIKTVIGHLEGCAGLAGVMKALLAIQNRTIPPNLHFNELNPAIAKFYGPLHIPTSPTPWPKLAPGVPARASVNSFGFGGTNSHAILESFENNVSSGSGDSSSSGAGVIGPLLFSAASGQSLLRSVHAHLEHLEAHPDLDLGDLSWVLQTRRTTHRVRTNFSGSSRDAIITNMQDWVATESKSSSSNIGHQPRLLNPKEIPGILGVFTGQGAQWPMMGRQLLARSPLFRKTLEECEAVLGALPAADAPKWSLVEEIQAEQASSRLHEAALSQPVCTAIQLGLVDVLAASGVAFDAVVGHSSGEIAAVYAAGIITRRAAMQIAYYRGLHARLARGPDGQRGGMLAAGLPLAKAMLLCGNPQFEGRLRVAASNAPTSVTLSGDLDAIEEARELLQVDGVFARALKVDTAYHSHHMVPCAEPYLQSLLSCDIQVSKPAPGSAFWSSSVRGDTELLKGDLSELKGPYWVSNMVQTVMFSQAVESSIWHGGPFDLAIEVGPHPALKGPVEQTLKNVYGSVPLYTGVLKRGADDVEAFSAAIGTFWSQLGSSTLDFGGYRAAFYEYGRVPAPHVLKNLPTYAWDHEKVYWRESAMSRRFRLADEKHNELLGRRAIDDNQRELRWRNLLRLHEVPWLRGHVVLGEVLLPAAAYVSLAIEAGRELAKTAGRRVQLFEVENVDILRPVVIPDNKEGVETVFTVRLLEGARASSRSTDVLRAEFAYYVRADPAMGSMVHVCNGELAVHLGELPETDAKQVLPPRDTARQDTVDVDCGRVYNMLDQLGLQYAGPFHALATSHRVLDYSTAVGIWSEDRLGGSNMIIHPAVLDVAFQTLFIALAHPASGLITSALLPSHVRRVRVSPIAAQRTADGDFQAEFESWVVKQTMSSVVGDLNLYDGVSGRTLAQVEGLSLNRVGEQDPSRDRPIFAKTVWTPDVALGLATPARDDADDAELLRQTEDFERIALFWARRLDKEMAAEDPSKFSWYHRRMLEANRQTLALVESGQHPVLRRQWMADGADVLDKVNAKYSPNTPVQLQLLHALGQSYPSIVRGQTDQLKVMMEENMLNRFFTDDLGCVRSNKFLADAVAQITHKYPRANMLEIGGGAGGTAWSVLNNINDAYASYTFTDMSSLFLAAAQEKFADFAAKIRFDTLDINNDPSTQGFTPHSYDIIIASNVLHATKNLTTTMVNTRRLLRPGGFLLVLETTGVENLSKPFIFSGLPTWWAGEEVDRQLRATVSTLRWEEVLNASGFSGLDMVVHDIADEEKHTVTVLLSQALDDKIQRLREPLTEIATAPPPEGGLILIGGKKLATAKMLSEIQKILPRPWRKHVTIVASIDALATQDLASIEGQQAGTDVICLHDLDEPLFATSMTEERLTTLQVLLMKARNFLWVSSATTATKTHAPRSSMFHGIARIAQVEMPHLHLQTLGLETGVPPGVAARQSLAAFVRLRETGGEPDQEAEGGKLLWAAEPEIEVLKSGEVVIPRVLMDQDLNDTFLASNRAITKHVNATESAVRAIEPASSTARMTLQTWADSVIDTESVAVRVQYTLHIPGSKRNGVYLVCGTDIATNNTVVAASEVNASIVNIPRGHVVAAPSTACTPDMLLATASRVLCDIAASLATPGKPVLFYGADQSFAAGVAAQLSKQAAGVYFASVDADAPDSWIRLHALSSKRTIEMAVPHDVALYVDCSESPSSAVGESLRECLPLGCEVVQLNAELLRKIFSGDQTAASSLLLEKSVSNNQETTTTDEETSCETIEAAALPNADAASLSSKRYITNWKADSSKSLSVTVPTLSTQGLFRSDRTYLMVGAAGGLGLSLCKWALSHGAKHLVITSRNPGVDPAILSDAQRLGASVRVLSMDVTSRESVEGVVQQIRASMPPIAGVTQCAMVLQDRLFLDMSIDELNGTLAAKVEGTEILDSVFSQFESSSSQQEDKLDFFVMLSSSASTIGNIGQANYHIGNLFMTSLAAARRARGLAGSVIHIGHVTDVGYIVKSKERTDHLAEHFDAIRMMRLSEKDVHHAFAHAVRGGRPGSTISPDIVMGIEPPTKPMPAGEVEGVESRIHWLRDPRLSHMTPMILLHRGDQAAGSGASAVAGSVRQRVEDAEGEEEAVGIVVEAFCARLDAMLQLPVGRAGENAHRPVIDLGIDSLVGVEIRNWFLKELGADVPVVKVLGGDSVLQVCTTAARTVMARVLKEGGGRERAKPSPPSVHPPSVPTVTLESPRSTTTSKEDDSAASTSESQTLDGPLSDSEATSISKNDDNASSTSSDNEKTHHQLETNAGPPASKPEILREERMSRAQARIWFVSKHLPDPAAYNMAFHYRVTGPLNMMRLRHALQTTTRYHECLRMCFYQRVGDGRPMQGLMASSAFELEHVADANGDDFKRVMDKFKTRVWDFERGETLGVSVLRREKDVHDFIFGYHHIITDVVGWSLFLRDLDRAYRLQPLGSNSLSHLDYTKRELADEAAGRYAENLKYWRSEFAMLPDALPLLPCASVRTRPSRHEERSESKVQSIYHTLSPDLATAIKNTCKQLRLSPFHFYLAVFQIFLAQQANVQDVCVGLVDANRDSSSDDSVSRMVGCFVNVLPVQTHINPTQTFSTIAKSASRKALSAFAHAGVPFDVLLDALDAPRWADGDTPPLFQAAINYRAAGGGWGEVALGGDCQMNLSLEDGKDVEPPYDISLGLMDLEDGCTLDLHCQGKLYGAEATRGMADSYIRLLEAFTRNPDLPIEKAPLHDEAHISQAIDLGKGPEMDFGWPPTLSQRFRDMCHLHPNEPAVIYGQSNLSYTELASRVDAVAKALCEAGCVPGDHVAVLCEPSADTIVAMLAVLESGCVYVPLDTSLPAARHAAMVRTCGPTLLLFHAATEENVFALSAESAATFQQMSLSDISDSPGAMDEAPRLDADAPAVLLFTSGSTGTPKGIVLTQGNFTNHLALKTHVLSLAQEHVLQHSSLGFDMSIVQVFCALANGGALVVAPRDARQDPMELTSLVVAQRVSLTIATPSEYLAWCRYGSSSLREHKAWKHACMGGELVTAQLKRELKLLGLQELRLTNCYGPTEITAAASFQTIDLYESAHLGDGEIEEEKAERRLRAQFAVGKALPNYTVRILNSAGEPQPVHHTGEICIGGKGVAVRGYLGLPDETRKKFISDPSTGDVLYRTGDSGRLLSDGTLLCFGRLEGDTQIKLRGLRVELEEVEAALLKASEGLLSSVVVSRRGDILVAHATISVNVGREIAVGDSELTSILRRLHGRLPQYFIPAAIIPLTALPTNANGKLHRKAIAALALPATAPTSNEQVQTAIGGGEGEEQESMNIREGELSLLWERVLPSTAAATMGRIAPSSDFFMRGGNSLLVMRLQALIRESMGVHVTTRTLFRASTLKTMAEAIFSQRDADAAAAEEDTEEIDWEREAEVPEWLRELMHEMSTEDDAEEAPPVKSEGLSVVLTGAAGFLGGRVLNALLQSPAVQTVRCIALDDDDDKGDDNSHSGGMQKIISSNSTTKTVQTFRGSLADPRLGLTPSETRLIERTADVIIHAGSSGHCLNNYAALRAPNVSATHRLAALALPRAVPLLFVSTNRVSLLAGNTEQAPQSMAEWKPAADGKEGLTATKWVGEVFLERLNRLYNNVVDDQQGKKRGWAVEVHRPCIVVGDQAPNSDSMNAILRFSLQMRCAPLVTRGRGFIDFKPVDDVARRIVDSALGMVRGREGGVAFKHHSSGTKVPVDRLREHLELVYGGAFEAMDMADWVVQAGKAGIDPLITAFLNGVLETDEEMVFPYLGA